jgi:hypothetical protein
MGNLIVHNGASLPVITDIEVKKNGKTVAQQSGIKIPNGDYSKPIPLQKGVYEVTATFKFPDGKTVTETKTVTITEENDKLCDFFQVPSEQEICIPPNLINKK